MMNETSGKGGIRRESRGGERERGGGHTGEEEGEGREMVEWHIGEGEGAGVGGRRQGKARHETGVL